ncbi:MAG TPA: DUF6622 family protein [Pseudoduganella sp.]|jgi:hypothetical protein
MLQQIIAHTPFYVWILLAFLASRGIAASRDSEVPLRRLVMLPAVMAVLSLQDMHGRFGLDGLPMVLWLAGVAAGAFATWRLTLPALPGSTPGNVLQRGSWLPLVLMMTIFATKYTVAVTCAVRPELAGDATFAGAVCALYGVFNGLFAGRALRSLPLPRALLAAGGR